MSKQCPDSRLSSGSAVGQKRAGTPSSETGISLRREDHPSRERELWEMRTGYSAVIRDVIITEEEASRLIDPHSVPQEMTDEERALAYEKARQLLNIRRYQIRSITFSKIEAAANGN